MIRNYYLKKLRKYPPHVAAYKVLNKIFARLKIIAASLIFHFTSGHISNEELLCSLNIHFRSLDDLSEYFKNKELTYFFPSLISKKETISLIKKSYPNSIKNTIDDADRICEHTFDMLGSGAVNLGYRINWHKDFKTGWTWKQKYFKLLHYTDYSKHYDVKIPWELSRCQHFVTLGKAYWYTNNERYAKEFVEQIFDWIESNPPKTGINWAGTMDVAIRLVNWIWGYFFFKESHHVDRDFTITFVKSILAHGKHIIGNLENEHKLNTNHYLSDLVGLIYLSLCFPEFDKSQEWGTFAIDELIREMGKQIYPDGTDYEGSISYHRLVSELFLSATLLVSYNTKNKFPEWYMRRLENMIDFVLYYTKPDGTVPQIGDSDDGRLHILSNYGSWNRLDHNYLLSIGATIFDRTDFKIKAVKFHEESMWLLGADGFNKFKAIEPGNFRIGSKAFNDGGIYLMRNSDMYMAIDCASIDAQSPSGHKHNSRLSFELSAYGKSFLIDPGSYIYTADVRWRNIFRSTEYHNTVEVDEYEQCVKDDVNIFLLNSKSEVKINKWKSEAKYDFLDAQHNGYDRLINPVIHNRRILFHKTDRYWLIQDLLTNVDTGKNSFKKIYKCKLHLHFASIDIKSDPDNSFRFIANHSDNIGLIIHPLEDEDMKISTEKGWFSCKYGEKKASPVVCYEKHGKLPVNFTFVFYPFIGSIPEIDFSKIGEKAQKIINGIN